MYSGDDRFVRTEVVKRAPAMLLLLLWRVDKNYHQAQNIMRRLAAPVRTGMAYGGVVREEVMSRSPQEAQSRRSACVRTRG